MSQISRPFQIAFVVLLLFVAVWFVALRGHSSSGSANTAATPAATTAAPSSQSASAQSGAQSSSPGGGTQASQGKTYTGSAPGVAGLSKAIERARGAVTQSQQNAKQLQQQSARASDETSASNSAKTHSSAATKAPAAKTPAANTPTAKAPTAKAPTAKAPASKSAVETPAMQLAVEAELKQGKLVAVLFWNPKGSVDATVRHELQAAEHGLHGKLAIHVAQSSQVGAFGSFTHAVQVYSTPTILLINGKGATASLSGLTDAFSIEQALKEVKSAK